MGMFFFGRKETQEYHAEDFLTGNEERGWLGVFVFPPPDREVVRSLGTVYEIREVESNDEYGVYRTVDKVITELVQKAMYMGANALLGFRLEMGTYQKSGSGWIEMHVIAYADAVILR